MGKGSKKHRKNKGKKKQIKQFNLNNNSKPKNTMSATDKQIKYNKDHEYVIKIKNESPLILSSGLSVGTLIDTDIAWDNNNLPYFSGKRLKGLLRESIQEVLDVFSLSGKSIFEKELKCEDILGNARKESKVKIYDLFLENYEKIIACKKYLLNKHSAIITDEKIKTEMTHVYFQTSIDEMGVAKDTSLRSSRALKAGYTFEGSIIIPDEYLILIGLACANLKYAGLNRNKGFGEIKVSIFNKGEEIIEKAILNYEDVINNEAN